MGHRHIFWGQSVEFKSWFSHCLCDLPQVTNFSAFESPFLQHRDTDIAPSTAQRYWCLLCKADIQIKRVDTNHLQRSLARSDGCKNVTGCMSNNLPLCGLILKWKPLPLDNTNSVIFLLPNNHKTLKNRCQALQEALEMRIKTKKNTLFSSGCFLSCGVGVGGVGCSVRVLGSILSCVRKESLLFSVDLKFEVEVSEHHMTIIEVKWSKTCVTMPQTNESLLENK